HFKNARMLSSVPSQTISTLPSMRFRAHPVMPSAFASFCANLRYSTPCTRPDTNIRTLIIEAPKRQTRMRPRKCYIPREEALSQKKPRGQALPLPVRRSVFAIHRTYPVYNGNGTIFRKKTQELLLRPP
ncbi:MAG: hypothetical protein UY22_C0046G0009, partial [Candidatus Amesbacteria bacterium GW2011_GWC1_48_10]